MGFQRKYLSADGMLNTVRESVQKAGLEDLIGAEYSWEDCVMSGLAVFGFKCPSLLQFEKQKAEEPLIRRNLRTLYQVKKAPSDTSLRERLDKVPARELRRPFKQIFAHLQRGKALERYQYLDGHYIVAIDGTGQFSSQKVHCDNCCIKNHRSGEVTYYHQMLGAVIVHPNEKVVIPLAPEPIVNGDGATKNDCERNASKRLVKDLRREHPHLKVLIVEDALASNHPHLSLLDSLDMNYVIGVKKGSHKHLFDWIYDLKPTVHIQEVHGTKHRFRCYDNVPLSDTHHEYRVNVIDYTEIKASGREQHFTWITKMEVTEDNVEQLMRAGRARWSIENETFNTLKNQGYHFEHNYGHGKEHLCSTMTMLMMLAFMIDQVQQLCCKHYQKARKHTGSLQSLFEQMRALIIYLVWDSLEQMLYYIGHPELRAPPDGGLHINKPAIGSF